MKLQIKIHNMHKIYHLLIPSLYLDKDVEQMSENSNKMHNVMEHAQPDYQIR